MLNVFKIYTTTIRNLLQYYNTELCSVFIDENLDEIFVDHDNWNSGIDYYSIRLNIPVNLYFKIQNRIEDAENKILECYRLVLKGIETFDVQKVSICPFDNSIIDFGNNTNDEMWKPGLFRLFISHSSVNKDSAIGLKRSLLDYGIDAFVAHTDIKPSKEWELTIENALFTMDALCAIVDNNFKKSDWCDQEVGIALGQHKMVFPINKGANPYGFFGKIQALPSKEKTRGEMAEDVWNAVISNPITSGIYSDKLIYLILNAKTENDALCYISKIDSFTSIEKKYADVLYSHCSENELLFKNNILSKLNAFFQKFELKPLDYDTVKRKQTEILDDLPF